MMQVPYRHQPYLYPVSRPEAVRVSQSTPAALRFKGVDGQNTATTEPASLGKTLKRWGRNTLIAVTIFVSGFTTGRWTGPEAPHAPTVSRVKDGDTFQLSDDQAIRLWGVDAPESAQPFGPEAKRYLEKLIQGKTLDLVKKSTNYDRKVCIAHVDSLDINGEMVRAGFAYAETKYAKGHYHEEEQEARHAKRGVWILPGGGERPWDYRERLKKESAANKKK